MSERRQLRAVMLGAPGSGKGTQAEILAREVGIPAISTGAMLRSAVASGNQLGQRVEAIMGSGALVDDQTMGEVVRERLAEPDASGGFLLDGYPRTGDQAENLDEILAELGVTLDAVVMMTVPEDELIRRSLLRQRADDTEEVIRNRQRVYRQQTEPLVERYERLGLLRQIDGFQSIEAVASAVLEVLEVAE